MTHPSTNPFEYNTVFGTDGYDAPNAPRHLMTPHPQKPKTPNLTWEGFKADGMLQGSGSLHWKDYEAHRRDDLTYRKKILPSEARGENLARKRCEWKSIQKAAERELADRKEASEKMAAWLEAEAERPLSPLTNVPENPTPLLDKYRTETKFRKARGLGKYNKRFTSEWTRAWRSVRQHYAGLKAQGIVPE